MWQQQLRRQRRTTSPKKTHAAAGVHSTEAIYAQAPQFVHPQHNVQITQPQISSRQLHYLGKRTCNHAWAGRLQQAAASWQRMRLAF
jgi:hypothetical protein